MARAQAPRSRTSHAPIRVHVITDGMEVKAVGKGCFHTYRQENAVRVRTTLTAAALAAVAILTAAGTAAADNGNEAAGSMSSGTDQGRGSMAGGMDQAPGSMGMGQTPGGMSMDQGPGSGSTGGRDWNNGNWGGGSAFGANGMN